MAAGNRGDRAAPAAVDDGAMNADDGAADAADAADDGADDDDELPPKRPSMLAVFAGGSGPKRSSLLSGALRQLQWRQLYTQSAVYPLPLADGRVLEIQQKLCSEAQGFGTGGSVWAAAVVLIRYLEKHKACVGRTVLDLGAGTGCAGLAAAALGADFVALTDLRNILWLAEENIDRTKSLFRGADEGAALRVVAAELDWGPGARAAAAALLSRRGVTATSAERGAAAAECGAATAKSEHFDVILVSECVLPQLYPIQPLVAALAALTGPQTTCFVAYEHRVFPEFDPRDRFRDLCAERGLCVSKIPDDHLDENFRAEDIEVWQVRRFHGGAAAQPHRVLEWGPAKWRLECIPDGGGVSAVLEFGDNEQSHAPSAVGAALWPSSLATVRLLRRLLGYPAHKPLRILELGSGLGLVAAALAKHGHAVVATEKSLLVQTLESNLEGNGVLKGNGVLSAGFGRASVEAHCWGDELPAAWSDWTFDLVICSDCAYDSKAVPPLIKTLTALWRLPSKPKMLLLANEHRTALDALLRAVRAEDGLPDVHAYDGPDKAQLWRLESQKPHQQPPPIALWLSDASALR
mmetsp:Transcript_14264/g.47645  ORF Transcript_14264/g.47645 Transcript_14264/m.47645 type:complete len:579 (-) Transcript_14264:85-1821(-)